MEDQIYQLTALDKLKRSVMARYFGHLSEDERLEAIKLSYDLAKQNMEKAGEILRGKPDFYYSMLCLALWKLNWTREALSKKNTKLTEKQAKEISKRRLASVFSGRKDRMKRGKLMTLLEVRLFHVVRALRNEGVSWRECSVYLQKHHHTKISHVHLHKLYKKITTERTIRGEE